jgi:hypothetical protein
MISGQKFQISRGELVAVVRDTTVRYPITDGAYGVVNYEAPIFALPQHGFTLSRFLSTHRDDIQLSIYFDCQRLLTSLESRCLPLFEDAIHTKDFDSLWSALPLIDTWRWGCLPQLLEALAKDDQAKTRSVVPTVMKAYEAGRGRMETLTKLLMLSLQSR